MKMLVDKQRPVTGHPPPSPLGNLLQALRPTACFLGLFLGLTGPGQSTAWSAESDPERALMNVFSRIEADQLDRAQQEIDQLVSSHPNFRLAHLVRGDLLLARSRGLTAFGNVSLASDEVEDLRAEARARLRAYKERPPANYVPRYLLQMGPDQRYALVVDTERSRVYLYENDQGRPRFVADYYVTQGKLGSGKEREGDKKTPLGVYHVTSFLPPQKLPDFYGKGAFPLNYPNAWDRQHGRTGSGIWLHGTPPETWARAPLASDGCVVLANADLDALAAHVQPGLTPVIISNKIEWLSLDDWSHQRASLNEAIEQWRKDWESRDSQRYLDHYSPRFRSDDFDLARWSVHKTRVNSAKRFISVGLTNLSLFRNPDSKEDLVVVTFDQDYRSSNLSQQSRKTQYWIRENDQWKILYEGKA